MVQAANRRETERLTRIDETKQAHVVNEKIKHDFTEDETQCVIYTYIRTTIKIFILLPM